MKFATRLPRARGVLVLLCFMVVPLAFADDNSPDNHIGYVDPNSLIRVAGGDDAIKVEVQIHGAALKLAGKMDNAIGRLARGLVAVRAVVLQLDDGETGERVLNKTRDYEQRLQGDGWQRLATVRDGKERVHVLIREKGDDILGLTVLIVDGDSGELIFTNIAGRIDLEAIAEFGKQVDIPGLDVLDEVN